MPVESIVDRVPFWLLFLLAAALVMVPVDIGYRLGRFARRRPAHEDEKWVESFLAPALGLLAFMLAFTFSWAQSRYEARRIAQFTAANAIATAFLRTAFAPQPYRDEMRRLLRSEIDLRLTVRDSSTAVLAAERITRIHDTLWRDAVAAAPLIPQSDIASLIVQSVNDVLSAGHQGIVAFVSGRIPLAIWEALCVLSALGTGLIGYATGLSGSRRSPAMIPLALGICIVMLLIADLDRPYGGMVRTTHEAIAALRFTIDRPSAPR